MPVNLELYRIFLIVAKAKSISQAARSLYISQPAVTQAIKQLERELGGALFYRGARGVNLTHEGELMFEYIERALEIIDTAESHFSEMLHLDRGQINIGASDTICKYFLLPYLERFRQLFPNLEIHVTNRITSETIALVRSGAVDLGFVNLPLRDDPQIEFASCLELHDCFVAGGDFAVEEDLPLTLERLSEKPLLMLDQESNIRRQIDSFFNERGIMIKPAFELGSVDLLIEFARIGLGIACISEEYICNELENGSLRKLDVAETPPVHSIGLAHMKRVPLSFAAENFIKLISEKNKHKA